jgi:NADPH2:quinone reductase
MKKDSAMRLLRSTGNIAQPLEFAEGPAPVPASDSVLVDVQAVSVNRGDILMTTMNPVGWELGWDIAGVVTAAAADGSGPAVGTRVVARLDEGGWAEQVAAPVSRLAVLPQNVSFVEAASLPVAGLHALRLLRASGQTLGKRILVTGAAGGVGRFLVELGAAAGAHITAVAGSTERSKGLRELGAEVVVTDINEAPGPYEVIIESAGGESLRAALGKIAPEGTIFLAGNSSGESTPVNFFEFFGGHESAQLKQFLFNASGSDADDLALLLELVATGRLHPLISVSADWSQANEVAGQLMNRQVAGKAVLTVGTKA